MAILAHLTAGHLKSIMIRLLAQLSAPVTGISGSDDVYYVTVSATQDGTYNLDLVSSGHGIADTASNQLTDTVPTGPDHTYTVSTAI